MYSLGLTFLNPVFPVALPFLSSTTTRGKNPSLLYFSASALFCSCKAAGSSWPFFFGKSAFTRIHSFLASDLKSSDCQIDLSSLMQGAHQSDPENTRIMFLFSLEAKFFASSKFFQSWENAAGAIAIDSKRKNVFMIVLFYYKLTHLKRRFYV